MAGYKQSVLNKKPICFLTFDGSSLYNRGSGELLAPFITDESNHNNNGLLQTNTGNRKSYSMGTTGLVAREVNAGQASFTFAIRGYDTLSAFPYEKSLVEVLHTESLKLNKDYTFMLLMNKTNNDNDFRGKKWDYTNNKYYTENLPSGWTTRTITRQIFRKGSTIDVTLVYNPSIPAYMKIRFPGYIGEIKLPDDFHNNTYHLTVTHKVINVGSNLYKHERKVYLNGIEHLYNLSDILTTPLSAENTAPVEIGGNRDVSDPDYLNDRQTTPLIIDQFAIYDKCLDADEIINLYKKINNYAEFIKSGRPQLYIPFNDSSLSSSLEAYVAIPYHDPASTTYNRAYYSDIEPYINRGVSLSNRTMGEFGADFQKGMVKYTTYYNAVSPVINASNDFTLSFWLSFTSQERGVVVSCQSNVYPYKGILFEVNQYGTQYKKGMIQVSLGDGIYLNPPLVTLNNAEVNYADGVLRYYTVRRVGTELELWIDGVRVSSIGVYSETLVPDFGQMFIMGMAPGQLSVVGTFGHLEFYNRALYDYEIRARSFFHVMMLIKGRVTVQGEPYRATIRVYDHFTGDLIKEGESDSDGYYTLNVYSNNYINVVYFDKYDNNITSRIFGPLVAHEYADVEWW